MACVGRDDKEVGSMPSGAWSGNLFRCSVFLLGCGQATWRQNSRGRYHVLARSLSQNYVSCDRSMDELIVFLHNMSGFQCLTINVHQFFALFCRAAELGFIFRGMSIYRRMRVNFM